MRGLQRLLVLLGFRRNLDTVEREIDEELTFHLELLAEMHHADGMEQRQARKLAMQQFGDIDEIRNRGRTILVGAPPPRRRGSLLDQLRQDLGFSLRLLQKNPGFAAVAILTLALGIGANTAIFSVVDAVLLRPLPYLEPERLVLVFERTPRQVLEGRGAFTVAPANFLDWQERQQVFSEMAAMKRTSVNLTGGEEPVRISAQRVSAAFFRILGAEAALGRTFRPEEDAVDADSVVVISHRLWRTVFGADPEVLGRTLQLNGEPHSIVGVMPADFSFTNLRRSGSERVDLWATDPFRNDARTVRTSHRLRVIGRLQPGVTLDQARAEMDAIPANLAQAYPETNEGLGALVIPLREWLVSDVRGSLLILMGAVGFVLLIACVNVANLLLARADARHREIAVRTAVGAGRLRLARQLLTESLLLALLGGAGGLLLARWGVASIVALAPDTIPLLEDVGIDGRVLGATLLTCLVTATFFGLVPALRTARVGTDASLWSAGHPATGKNRRLLGRQLLVATQIALALVLLIGVGLMLATFARLQQIPLGFETENVYRLYVQLPREKYAVDSGSVRQTRILWNVRPEKTALVRGVVERLESLPGIEAAGAINYLPFFPNAWHSVLNIEGRPGPFVGRWLSWVSANEAGQPDRAMLRPITPGYFQTMGIPLLHGRTFSWADDASATDVAIIDEAMAEEHWPGQSPLGRSFIAADGTEDTPRPFEVVGVVANVWERGFYQWNLDEAADRRPTMYIPQAQQSGTYDDAYIASPMQVNFIARYSGEDQHVAAAMREVLKELDPQQPIANLQSLDEYVAEALTDRRFYTLLIGTFSAVSLLLALMGIYGVMAYQVSQRVHEIGVRLALGAHPAMIVKMIVRGGLAVGMLGVAMGVLGALALTRLLSSWLWGVTATDPFTFASLSAVMLVVALIACVVPARRAARVDAVISLRAE